MRKVSISFSCLVFLLCKHVNSLQLLTHIVHALQLDTVDFRGMTIGMGTSISRNDVAFGKQHASSTLPGGQIETSHFRRSSTEQFVLDAELAVQTKLELLRGRYWRETGAGARIGTRPGKFDLDVVVYKDVITRIKSGEFGFSR
jgi:hypothetical protein